MYEKYRTYYELETSEVSKDFGSLKEFIMLDELPYGNFVEIEGPDAASIRAAADSLNLKWEAAIAKSYLALFERLRGKLGYAFRDLTFENFTGLNAQTVQFFDRQ
jgi:hypothetical protein